MTIDDEEQFVLEMAFVLTVSNLKFRSVLIVFAPATPSNTQRNTSVKVKKSFLRSAVERNSVVLQKGHGGGENWQQGDLSEWVITWVCRTEG